MERVEEFVDDRQNSGCIHCTRWLAELDTTEDHVPTKSPLTNLANSKHGIICRSTCWYDCSESGQQ